MWLSGNRFSRRDMARRIQIRCLYDENYKPKRVCIIKILIRRRDNAVVKEDFRPSVLNQPGQQYPMVNSQGYARFRVVAPDAKSVIVSLGLGGLISGIGDYGGTDKEPQWIRWGHANPHFGNTMALWTRDSIIITSLSMVVCLMTRAPRIITVLAVGKAALRFRLMTKISMP